MTKLIENIFLNIWISLMVALLLAYLIGIIGFGIIIVINPFLKR